MPKLINFLVFIASSPFISNNVSVFQRSELKPRYIVITNGKSLVQEVCFDAEVSRGTLTPAFTIFSLPVLQLQRQIPSVHLYVSNPLQALTIQSRWGADSHFSSLFFVTLGISWNTRLENFFAPSFRKRQSLSDRNQSHGVRLHDKDHTHSLWICMDLICIERYCKQKALMATRTYKDIRQTL